LEFLVSSSVSQWVNFLVFLFKLLILVPGPLIWAPFSEVLGRRIVFIITYVALTAFNAGAAGSQNIWTVIILRFFAGSFGSSPLTNVSHLLIEFHFFLMNPT
jgi:MFS family permease